MMNGTKYVAMDVHTASISVAVLNFDGKLIMESVIEAKRSTIVQFIQGLRGELLLTFEEGTWSAWLYDLLTPYVTKVLVCDPRRNALLKKGSANDRIDARKLAELLRGNLLRSVYHGQNGLRTLKELARAYLTINKDLVRVMSRIKAVYRSWGIPCAGQSVYHPRHRDEWLGKNSSPRAKNIQRGNCFARFRPWARSARPCSWPLFRLRIGSAPIECSGSTVGLES